MIIEGYELPLVNHPDARMPIYPHQAAMIDAWSQHDAFLLTTKTGSGKTAAWLLGYLKHLAIPEERNIVCVYPTNELLRDQARSIENFVTKEQGLACTVRRPGVDSYDQADIEIVRIDAAELEQYRVAWRCRSKGDALQRLLHSDRPKIILTNPDTLYQLFTLRYSQSAHTLGVLQAYKSLVFDEFHLYTGVELAHALFLVYLARRIGIFKRTVLLSATPHPQVDDYISRLLSPHRIEAHVECNAAVVGSRIVTHQVNLLPQRAPLKENGGVVRLARDLLLDLKHDLEDRRQHHKGDSRYVPAVAILNSVVNVIDLEDCLRGAGFGENEVVPMRGLMARSERRLNSDQLVIIGTSAVEVGVDFQTDYLLFEASDVSSFTQRLGRLARHWPGTAYLLGSARECGALSACAPCQSRSDFETMILRLYPQADARAWFVDTELGTFTAMAQAYGFLRRVEDDWKATPADRDQVHKWFFETLDDYARILGIDKHMGKIRGLYKRHHKVGVPWVAAYERIDSFRTSLPTVEVEDRAEQHRGRSAYTYSADVKTLLERSRGLRREGKNYVIDGYERYHRVYTNMSFRDRPADLGKLLSTQDCANLMIKRLTPEGTLSPVSHEMSRGDDPHTFVFVPSDMVEAELDWRLATFPAGAYNSSYVVAFDGDALLLKEIYRREKARRSEAQASPTT